MIRYNIPIGISEFEKIRENDYYYVDKTELIQTLVKTEPAEITLFTRPRRFGKTLNQSMIKRFFENEITEQGAHVDNGYLFDGLDISRCGEEILQHQQQYPVVFLSMKSGKQPNYDMAYKCLIDEICKEFVRHRYILKGDALPETEAERYEQIMNRRAEPAEYAKGLAFLSECLARN